MENTKSILIEVRANGYWVSNESIYLDDKTYSYPLAISDFHTHFYTDEYETQWTGNNPFCESEVIRYAIDSSSYVEIYFAKHSEEVIIYKVLGRDYKTTAKLLKALGTLEEVYVIVQSRLEERIEELKAHDAELDTRAMEE